MAKSAEKFDAELMIPILRGNYSAAAKTVAAGALSQRKKCK
jgi:hypothetical protein